MLDIEALCRIAGEDVILALADDDRDGVADAPIIAESITGAAREVALEISRGGVTTDPLEREDLHGIIATLAVARLFERRRDPMPEGWVSRAARARAVLISIAEGRHPISRACSSGDPSREDRLFTHERLRGL